MGRFKLPCKLLTLSPEQAVSVLSNRQAEGLKVSTNENGAAAREPLLHDWRDTTHRTGDGDEVSV